MTGVTISNSGLQSFLSCPRLSRASRLVWHGPCAPHRDGRDKPGHDEFSSRRDCTRGSVSRPSRERGGWSAGWRHIFVVGTSLPKCRAFRRSIAASSTRVRASRETLVSFLASSWQPGVVPADGVPGLPVPCLRGTAAGAASPLRQPDASRKRPSIERGCLEYNPILGGVQAPNSSSRPRAKPESRDRPIAFCQPIVTITVPGLAGAPHRSPGTTPGMTRPLP
jgi:hypothetical protein